MKIELFNDNFQNYKSYHIPTKAQLVIADIPYNLGRNAYASNKNWYIDGKITKDPSAKAGKTFFNTDEHFNIAEFFHFTSKMLKDDPKLPCQAPAMIVFCAWQQIPMVVNYGQKHGFMRAYPLFFIKNSSAQVLKANMKIVGAVETAIVLYRDKLPKFHGHGHMILNWFEWRRDDKSVPKIHPTQKPVNLLKRLIEIFTDVGDTVIDPVAGSASTLRACAELDRNAYGFEIDKTFYRDAKEQMLTNFQVSIL